ncbi:MAG: hypothetical protein JXA36_06230 [Coriobacteriia bacterium]|nr:hypothetical protein [Coriobacteriia bacterium]
MNRLPLSGTPFPFGLTFVPPEALGAVAGEAVDPVSVLVGACSVFGASFVFVPAEAPWAEQAVPALASEDVAPLWAVSGPLWPVIEKRGVLDGLRDTLTHPGEIGAELEESIEALLAEVDRGVRCGARGIVLAEDLAGTAGPLIAPDFAIAELLPLYGRIVQQAESLTVPAVFHSDGDIRSILPAIRRAGFVGVHAGGGLSFAAFERLYSAAREADLAVIGGMVTAELGDPFSAESLGNAVGVLAGAGGLLVADDGGISTGGEVAGLATALEAARSV